MIEHLGLEEGNIHSNIEPLVCWIIAPVTFLIGGIAKKQTTTSTRVEFDALVAVKMNVDNASKGSGKKRRSQKY